MVEVREALDFKGIEKQLFESVFVHGFARRVDALFELVKRQSLQQAVKIAAHGCPWLIGFMANYSTKDIVMEFVRSNAPCAVPFAAGRRMGGLPKGGMFCGGQEKRSKGIEKVRRSGDVGIGVEDAREEARRAAAG